MKVKSVIAASAASNWKAIVPLVLLVPAGLVFWLTPATVHAAAAGGAGSGAKSTGLTLESIPGSAIPRVILSAKAAERLGIETGKVSEESISRKQMVSGLVVPVGDKQPEHQSPTGVFGGYGRMALEPKPAGDEGAKTALAPTQKPIAPIQKPVAGPVWIVVTLSPGEYERLAKDKPARLLPLSESKASGKELMAQPSGMAPVEDLKRTMMSLYYQVPGKDHGLAINNRLRVELPLSGSEEKQKTVPYGAVHYDAKGAAWVYVNTKPLSYERQRITIERVIGDIAVLSDGPAIGTPVVTVGAALLHGTEIFKK